MSMKPLNRNIIVSRIEPNLETEFGIILKNPLEPDKGYVERISDMITEVSVGDQIILDWNNAKEIDVNLYLVSIDDVVLIL